MMRSLRSRVVGGMALLVALVFVIALLGVNSIRALDQSVGRELSILMASTDLGSGLVSSVAAEIRSAEQYLVRPGNRLRLQVLEEGDSAYALQRRYRGLKSLTTSDRYVINQIAGNQARVEVAYAMAHALTDLKRPDEARRYAELARFPSDTLLSDVRGLSLAQTSRSMERAADLGRQADHRRQMLWLLFFVSLLTGILIVFWTVRMVDRPLTQLVGAVERFGAGDLRPVRLGSMPTELERLSRAMDDMGGRLRSVVVAVVGEARHA
jgi:methyl-accepting chemotaxis protein